MKRSIILVVAAFFPDSYGGAERQALILAQALGRAGIDVTLVAPSTSSKASLHEETEFGRIIRKRVKAYPNLGGKFIFSFLSWSIWFPYCFSGSEWRGVPIYVFHARLHALGPAFAAILNRSLLAIKLGGGGEASEFDALRIKKYIYGRLIEGLLRRRVNLFVANSDQIAEELRSLGVTETQIVEFPNGVELPPIDKLNECIALRNGKRFVYAGRLVPDKSVDVIYRAVVAVVELGEALQLRLVGSGSEKDRLESVNSTSLHRESVTFAGFVEDVYSEFELADYFICASMREGQSNALLEAMSAGLIPIVYAASGVREVVKHRVSGFVVEDSTKEAFVEAISWALALSDEERTSISLQARKFVEEHIGIDSIANRTVKAIFR